MKISVCIPTYEMGGLGKQYLSRCLNSILKQDFSNIEIIVSDHSDNDDLKTLIEDKYKESVTYLKNKQHRGCPASNTNNAINNSSGEYIKVMNQDDFFISETCLSQMESMATGNNWVVTSFIHYNEKEKSYYNPMTPIFPEDPISLLKGINTIGCPSVGIFPNQGDLFDPKISFFMDCDMWYRMNKKYGSPLVVNQTGVAVSLGDHNLTHQFSNKDILSDTEYCFRKYNLS